MLFIYSLGYFFIISILLIEIFIRKGENVKSLKTSKYDKRSTKIIAAVYIISIFIISITPILNKYSIGYIKGKIVINIIGIIMTLFGIIIRIVAIKTLGRFYTRILKETPKHKLITDGIYKYLRHPGYLGNILVFIGLSITMSNYICLIIISIIDISTYNYRMIVEEKMLNELFGEEYKKYQEKSKKIIPLIY
jgi:protein-S-isoprenylcysteine O-methyltransferase Ste14